MEEVQLFADQFPESLPSADFDLDNPDNVEVFEGGHVPILFPGTGHFDSSCWLAEDGEDLVPQETAADVPPSGNATATLGAKKAPDSSSPASDEGRGDGEDLEMAVVGSGVLSRSGRSCPGDGSGLGGKSLPGKEALPSDDGGADGEIDVTWKQFKEEFESHLDASEREMSQLDLEHFRQGLLLAATLSIADQLEQGDAVTTDSQSSNARQPVTESPPPGTRDDSDASPAVDASHQTAPTGPRPSLLLAGHHHGGGVLHSNRYERISEAELDMVLEAIEEESEHSREGSRSPAPVPTNASRASDEDQFLWQPPPVHSDRQLLYQLEQICLKEGHGNGAGQTGHGRSQSTGKINGNTESEGVHLERTEPATTFLDLRPCGTDHTIKEPRVTASVERLMRMRRPFVRSSSEDSEDNDPATWQLQREHFKALLTATPLATPTGNRTRGTEGSGTNLPAADSSSCRASQDGNKSFGAVASSSQKTSAETQPNKDDRYLAAKVAGKRPSAANRHHPRRKKVQQARLEMAAETSSGGQAKGAPLSVLSPRERRPSSSSLSEDDVFLPLDEAVKSSPTSVLKPSDICPPDKQKKGRRRKKEGKKGGDGAKGDGEKASRKSDSSKKNSAGQRSARVRSSSLTQSSDEDFQENSCKVRHKSEPIPASLDSPEAGTSVERVKAYLQHVIQARRPPSLLNVPSTPPLFHMDVSFGPVLAVTDPLRPTHHILIMPLSHTKAASPYPHLPLSNSTATSTSATSFSEKDHFLLFALLVTWLVGLAMPPPEQEGLFAPFYVTGIMQSVLEGQTCLLTAISLPDKDDAGEQDEGPSLQRILELSSLDQVFCSLLSHQQVASAIPSAALKKLRQLSHIPLSDFFTNGEEVAAISIPLSFYWHCHGSSSVAAGGRGLLLSSSTPETAPCTISLAELASPAHRPHLLAIVFTVISRSLSSGLDLAGMRLLHHSEVPLPSPSSPCQPYHQRQNQPVESAVHANVVIDQPLQSLQQQQPLLALALRGPHANITLGNIIGPADTALARITDPQSISAVYGSCSSSLSCPLPVFGGRGRLWAEREVARWFGGRACADTGTILGVSDSVTKTARRRRQKVRFSESESEDGGQPPLVTADTNFFPPPPLLSNRPTLTVAPYAKIIFVLSPRIRPSLYGRVLRAIGDCGYDVLGMKRLRLNFKRAQAMGILAHHLTNFAPSSTSSPLQTSPSTAPLSLMTTPSSGTTTPSLFVPDNHLPSSCAPPLPSLLLVLGRENALSHSHFLKQCLYRLCFRSCQQPSPDTAHFASATFAHNLSSGTQDERAHDSSATLGTCNGAPNRGTHDGAPDDVIDAFFHAVDYSDDCVRLLGSFVFTPSAGNGGAVSASTLSESLREEVALVAVAGSNSLEMVADVLDTLTNVSNIQNGVTTEMDTCKAASAALELMGLKMVPELSRCQAKKLSPSSLSTSTRDLVDQLTANVTVVMAVRGMNACREVRTVLLAGGDTETSANVANSPSKMGLFCSGDLEQAFNVASSFFIDKELYSDAEQWCLGPYLPPSCLHDCAVLASLQQDPDPLLSVFQVAITQIRLLAKILEKLSVAKFEVIGITTLVHQKPPRVAVCVQRCNAIWHLKHLLEPFILDSSYGHDTISYCTSFVDSVAETQRLFANSVHFPKAAVLKYYQVSQALNDCFMFEDRQFSPVPQYVPPSAIKELLEWNILIVPWSFLPASATPTVAPPIPTTPPYVDILHCLVQARFSLSEIQMVQLSRETASAIHGSVGPSTCTLETEDLSNGPCLLIGVWRDNALSCFHSVIQQSLYQQTMGSQVGSVASITDILCKVVVPCSKAQLQALSKVLFANPRDLEAV